MDIIPVGPVYLKKSEIFKLRKSLQMKLGMLYKGLQGELISLQ